MHAEQRILQQRHTPQGNVTILPTEMVDLPTETGLQWCYTPPHPLSAGPAWVLYLTLSRNTAIQNLA